MSDYENVWRTTRDHEWEGALNAVPKPPKYNPVVPVNFYPSFALMDAACSGELSRTVAVLVAIKGDCFCVLYEQVIDDQIKRLNLELAKRQAERLVEEE